MFFYSYIILLETFLTSLKYQQLRSHRLRFYNTLSQQDLNIFRVYMIKGIEIIGKF